MDTGAALLRWFEILLVDAREINDSPAPDTLRLDRSRPHQYLALRKAWREDPKRPFLLYVDRRW